jgi:predicted 2-oxoglutarate/Fe(II)-dependent dioxygenase YbiX
MERINNLLSYEAIDKAFHLFRTLSNTVEIDGRAMDRHSIASVGSFMLSKFTHEEFGFIWDEISTALGDRYEPVYYRVLKYNPGCFIPEHVDSYAQGQQESNHSLIIQMVPPDSYAGGIPSVNGKPLYLNVGDAVIYNYSESHAVGHIRKGIRYVINLRLKKVK